MELSRKDKIQLAIYRGWKWLTKFRQFNYHTKHWRFGLYLFQRTRWSIGMTVDNSGGFLFCIELIFVYLDVEHDQPPEKPTIY